MDSNKRFQVYDEDIPEQAEKAYDEIAEWYSARKRGSYEFKILLPAILNLLGNMHGKNLLDVGCGPGIYASELVKRGADVLGIDISRKMLDKARTNTKAISTEVAFLKADAQFLPFKDGSFDIAVLILTILNTKIVQEVSRILKPKGTLLFSDTHPIIESKGRWESNTIGAGDELLKIIFHKIKGSGE